MRGFFMFPTRVGKVLSNYLAAGAGAAAAGAADASAAGAAAGAADASAAGAAAGAATGAAGAAASSFLPQAAKAAAAITAAKTRDLFMMIFLRGGLKQFPETDSMTWLVIKTETKALELFYSQPTIIAFSSIHTKLTRNLQLAIRQGKIPRGFSTIRPTSSLRAPRGPLRSSSIHGPQASDGRWPIGADNAHRCPRPENSRH